MTEAPGHGGGQRIAYARCSTEKQDLRAQKAELHQLGYDRLFTDEGITGTKRDTRAGLAQALAALRAGDTLLVTKLDRLARSVPDARAIADEVAQRGASLQLGSMVYDPHDPMGKMFFNNLATFAEFEADLARMRTREGMAEARRQGKLRGRQTKFTPAQDREIRRMRDSGDYTIKEIAALFNTARTSIYRSLDRSYAATLETQQRTDAEQVPGQTSSTDHEDRPAAASATSNLAPEPKLDRAAASRMGKQPPTALQQRRTARRGGQAAAGGPEQAMGADAQTPVTTDETTPTPEPTPEPRPEPRAAEQTPHARAEHAGGELRAVHAREALDVEAATLERNPTTGTYRVTAPTADRGEPVCVGWLERDPRRSSKWQARSVAGLTPGGAHRTRHEALVALLQPHYLPTHGGRARTRSRAGGPSPG